MTSRGAPAGVESADDLGSLTRRMFHLSAAFADTRAVWIVAKLGIADLLVDAPRSAADLARATGVAPDPLYRVMRVAAGAGVLAEVEPSHFALTPLGELLRTDAPRSMRAWVIMTGGPIFGSFIDAMFSVETGKPAFERVFGGRMYDYMTSHPEDAAAFNAAMVAYGGQAVAGLLERYDLSTARTLVDVGAGPGTVVSAVLKIYPEMTGVLFDLPHIAALAHGPIAEAGLADRCRIVGGDFFQAVPSGGDVYVLSSILHNWDDERATAILKSCRAALPVGGKLLVLEMVIPPGDEPHFGKPTDMVMLVAVGGRERTQEEYERLLTAAGFRLARVIHTQFLMSVLEAFAA